MLHELTLAPALDVPGGPSVLCAGVTHRVQLPTDSDAIKSGYVQSVRSALDRNTLPVAARCAINGFWSCRQTDGNSLFCQQGVVACLGFIEAPEDFPTNELSHHDAMAARMADAASDRPVEIQPDRLEHHGPDLVSGI